MTSFLISPSALNCSTSLLFLISFCSVVHKLVLSINQICYYKLLSLELKKLLYCGKGTFMLGQNVLVHIKLYNITRVH